MKARTCTLLVAVAVTLVLAGVSSLSARPVRDEPVTPEEDSVML